MVERWRASRASCAVGRVRAVASAGRGMRRRRLPTVDVSRCCFSRQKVPRDMDPDVKRAAEAQMRRHAPDDAENVESKRAKTADGGAPRFAYAALKSLLAKGTSARGFIVTCAFNRERSATMDAMRVLAASGSGALAVAKLPCHGVLLLLRQGDEGDEDAARVASRAVASVRAAPTSGSRFVEKVYPVSGTFAPDDDDGLDEACARVVREAIARGGLTSGARFAATYNRRVRPRASEDGQAPSDAAAKSGDGASKPYERESLRTRVASSIEKACKASGVDIVVDLKRPNFVVFIEVLATSTSEHVVALGGSIAEDDLYVVKSARIAPVSICALTSKVETPKWMILKEEKRLAAEKAAAAVAAANNASTKTTDDVANACAQPIPQS